MDGKTYLEKKYELLVEYLKKNNRKLMEGSMNVELTLRKHFSEGVSFKVMHTDIGNYYYAEDISVDFSNNVVNVYYHETGDMHLRRNRLSII